MLQISSLSLIRHEANPRFPISNCFNPTEDYLQDWIILDPNPRQFSRYIFQFQRFHWWIIYNHRYNILYLVYKWTSSCWVDNLSCPGSCWRNVSRKNPCNISFLYIYISHATTPFPPKPCPASSMACVKARKEWSLPRRDSRPFFVTNNTHWLAQCWEVVIWLYKLLWFQLGWSGCTTTQKSN